MGGFVFGLGLKYGVGGRVWFWAGVGGWGDPGSTYGPTGTATVVTVPAQNCDQHRGWWGGRPAIAVELESDLNTNSKPEPTD